MLATLTAVMLMSVELISAPLTSKQLGLYNRKGQDNARHVIDRLAGAVEVTPAVGRVSPLPAAIDGSSGVSNSKTPTDGLSRNRFKLGEYNWGNTLLVITVGVVEVGTMCGLIVAAGEVPVAGTPLDLGCVVEWGDGQGDCHADDGSEEGDDD